MKGKWFGRLWLNMRRRWRRVFKKHYARGPVEALVTVRKEKRRDEWEWFQVSPDDLYPATLDYIAEMLSGKELVPSYLRKEMEAARKLPAKAWECARQHREDTFWPALLGIRAAALEHARRVFTAILRAEHDAPIALHITADPTGKWKL